VGIVILSLANRETVTVNLLPQGLSDVYVWSMDIPLYLVSLASILTGLMIGYVLEWLRESKHRRMAVEKRREASQLASEVDKLRKQHLSEEDEVLAILETKTKNA
ncbi:MAG: LapA family protein, partial [Pseudomonadota bacterium]